MTTPEQPDANKPLADKAAEAVTGKPLDKPVADTVSEAATDAKDTLQDGFSRFDATARKVTSEAAEHASETADDVSEAAQAYAHQGLDSLNRAGTAVAGAITQRPFVALISALLGGAMVALARR
ncbi:hypothetical protein [Roseomonas haemaphysalidis]|uniref:CsbD family protein n=1 Tax=Roseomonas haemaphysalidis TaxID=2768162 RepID=A0ABS3KMB0_9PROT|nr:hypothetical protein [Roseomonas haemaphysalidis]MBO1078167.1 hypothetical protein [Roseomonas haemaphysalidis]